MGVDKQLDKVKELYTNNIKKKGVDSAAVGWNTRECQILRFSKLSSVIEDEQLPISVNDYGCGYGAHLQYLEEKLGIKVNEYNGYDLSREMLQAATNHLIDYKEKLNLLQSSEIITTADYSFVSGTFNVRFDAREEDWENFIKNKLHELNEYSDKGFSFNLLTSFVDYQEPHLFYGDPCYWFEFCKKNFSKYVSLLHDYPLWEWTIIVKKDR